MVSQQQDDQSERAKERTTSGRPYGQRAQIQHNIYESQTCNVFSSLLAKSGGFQLKCKTSVEQDIVNQRIRPKKKEKVTYIRRSVFSSFFFYETYSQYILDMLCKTCTVPTCTVTSYTNFAYGYLLHCSRIISNALCDGNLPNYKPRHAYFYIYTKPVTTHTILAYIIYVSKWNQLTRRTEEGEMKETERR